MRWVDGKERIGERTPTTPNRLGDYTDRSRRGCHDLDSIQHIIYRGRQESRRSREGGDDRPSHRWRGGDEASMRGLGVKNRIVTSTRYQVHIKIIGGSKYDNRKK